jgi:iron complex transport system permease protein
VTEASRNLGANPRADNRGRHLIWISVVAILLFLLHLGLGSTEFVSPLGVIRELLRGKLNGIWDLTTSDPATLPEQVRANLENILSQNSVVWAIRLPKALYCVLAGGILGVVGSAFQALFRNPLAEPFTVGVSSGAAVGGAIAQILGLDASMAFLGTPLLGFVGGMASLALVLALAKRRHGTDSTTLLLAGVVVSSLLSALLSVMILMSGKDSNDLMRWLLGSTSPQFMERVVALAVMLVAGLFILFRQTRRLNAFAIGEATARRLGVDPGRLRWTVLVVGTAMAATAVGTVGAIAFLGLVAPHIARGLVGVDWRWSLPGSLAVGSGLMIAADVLAQRGLPLIGHLLTGKDLLATGLPVGVVTALLGAPSLLILLRKD